MPAKNYKVIPTHLEHDFAKEFEDTLKSRNLMRATFIRMALKYIYANELFEDVRQFGDPPINNMKPKDEQCSPASKTTKKSK